MKKPYFILKFITGIILGLAIGVGGAKLFFDGIGFLPPPPIIPQDPPSETDRVHASGISMQGKGFSMVVPKSWHSSSGEWIRSQSATPSSSSYPLGRILARECSPNEFSEEMKTAKLIVFQGSVAHLITTELTDNLCKGFQIVFQRSNEWYALAYFANRDVDDLPPVVMKYFETFRIDETLEQ